MEIGEDAQTGSGRLKTDVQQEIFTEAMTAVFIAGPEESKLLIFWRRTI